MDGQLVADTVLRYIDVIVSSIPLLVVALVAIFRREVIAVGRWVGQQLERSGGEIRGPWSMGIRFQREDALEEKAREADDEAIATEISEAANDEERATLEAAAERLKEARRAIEEAEDHARALAEGVPGSLQARRIAMRAYALAANDSVVSSAAKGGNLRFVKAGHIYFNYEGGEADRALLATIFTIPADASLSRDYNDWRAALDVLMEIGMPGYPDEFTPRAFDIASEYDMIIADVSGVETTRTRDQLFPRRVAGQRAPIVTQQVAIAPLGTYGLAMLEPLTGGATLSAWIDRIPDAPAVIEVIREGQPLTATIAVDATGLFKDVVNTMSFVRGDRIEVRLRSGSEMLASSAFTL